MTSLCSVGMPTGEVVEIFRHRFTAGEGPRVALVAGIRGDAPEGMRVAHLVTQFLSEHHDALQGVVDVYPCLNPLAAFRGSRRWPFFDQDLNRRFPGRPNGHAPDRVAWTLLRDLDGADCFIELRGARPDFCELPQAQVRAGEGRAVELARWLNVEVIWKREPGPAAPSTLAYQVPDAIVLEGGRGGTLSEQTGERLRDGVLNLLAGLKILPQDSLPFHWTSIHRPAELDDGGVHRISAASGGFFLPKVQLGSTLERGQEVGQIVEPTTGALREIVTAPSPGRVMAIRERPVVFPGSMIARTAEAADV